MNPTHRIGTFVALLIGMACIALAEDAAREGGITVTLHDSHGVSADSAKDHLLEVILFKPHTAIHFKISNTTDRGLTLWRPKCPQGDDAMSIEFRESVEPEAARAKVLRGHTGYVYTGGMGIPKWFTLAPHNDLIVNVDFQNDWVLPFAMKADETRELEMRAVYRSEPLTPEQQKRLLEGTEVPQVWNGAAASEWQKVRIINRTGGVVEWKQ